MFLWWPSTKIVQAIWIRQKTWPPGGGAYFPYIFYIENFKNLLVRNHWTDFNIILHKCSFGDPLPRLFKPFEFVKKHGRQGAGLIFPIYLQYGSGKRTNFFFSFRGPILQSAIFRRVVWSKPFRVKKIYSKLCARYSEDIQRTSVYPWYSECLRVFASGDRLFCTGKFDHSDHSLTRR